MRAWPLWLTFTYVVHRRVIPATSRGSNVTSLVAALCLPLAFTHAFRRQRCSRRRPQNGTPRNRRLTAIGTSGPCEPTAAVSVVSRVDLYGLRLQRNIRFNAVSQVFATRAE